MFEKFNEFAKAHPLVVIIGVLGGCVACLVVAAGIYEAIYGPELRAASEAREKAAAEEEALRNYVPTETPEQKARNDEFEMELKAQVDAMRGFNGK